MKKLHPSRSGKVWTLLLIALLAITGGFFVGRWTIPQPEEPVHRTQSDSEAESARENETEDSQVKWWTCSMHPQVRLPSGDMKCPICFMDLIPVESDSAAGDEDMPVLKLSPRAVALAEVETAPAERMEVTKTIRLVGKIQPDETNLSMITAWVPGRLERLFVDYTGMEVRQGDHLVEIYSPSLYSAQQELLQAIQSTAEIRESASGLLTSRSQSLVDSARSKLLRLGLTEDQVKEVEDRGKPIDTLTIYSPTSGIVVRREGTEGMYVTEGSMIYTIADLRTVWLILDAYESDLVWLHYGQSVEFETEAYPGEVFEGKLVFISPVVDERSRSVKLRVNVPNSDRRLKPGMFAHARIRALPAEKGKVIAPELAGKWICPMHPEVIESLFGYCPICGMQLETAQSLGYIAAHRHGELPLVIPDTAPLVTGKRAIVYVERQNEDGIRYEGREIELGPHADGYYIVDAGLAEGERVVTKGNFKIDSALQIQAKPSMMSPDQPVASAVTPSDDPIRDDHDETGPEATRAAGSTSTRPDEAGSASDRGAGSATDRPEEGGSATSGGSGSSRMKKEAASGTDKNPSDDPGGASTP